MTGAESNGEMKTKRNAVSFRGEINSFPFLHSRSISLSLSDAVSFLPSFVTRTFPSISPPAHPLTALARSVVPSL